MLFALLLLVSQLRYVAVGYVFVGAFDGHKWVSGNDYKVPSKVHSKMTSFRLGKLGPTHTLIGIGPSNPHENLFVEIRDTKDHTSPFDSTGECGLALASHPRILRPVQTLSLRSETYAKVVRDFARAKGVRNPSVVLTGLARWDLDGDGKMEVVISAASRKDLWQLGGVENDREYMTLLVRYIKKNGQAGITDVLWSHYSPGERPDDDRLTAIADLDGDSVMEIISSGRWIEGYSGAVYRWKAGKVKVLVSNEDGA